MGGRWVEGGLQMRRKERNRPSLVTLTIFIVKTDTAPSLHSWLLLLACNVPETCQTQKLARPRDLGPPTTYCVKKCVVEPHKLSRLKNSLHGTATHTQWSTKGLR